MQQHRTITGRILYTSRKEGREGQELGVTFVDFAGSPIDALLQKSLIDKKTVSQVVQGLNPETDL